MKKEKRERKNMNLEQAYNILEEFYEEIPGAYDDNWIDYNMETAMRKSCLEEILKENADVGRENGIVGYLGGEMVQQ